MTQPAKAQEPSMEEILASIRRIIADDEPKASSPEAAPAVEAPRAVAPRVEPVRNEMRAEPAKRPTPVPAAPPAAAAPAKNNQDDIDAMLAGLDDEVIAPAAAASEPEPDVLELTESMAMPPRTAAAAFRTIDSSPDVEFSESVAPEPPMREPPPVRPRAYEPSPRAPQPEPVAEEPAQPLLSSSTVAAVDSAFNSLAHTVFAQNARTLEDLVKEMLRPMLKSWLDDNLPQVVERIVKAEIERVSRGR